MIFVKYIKMFKYWNVQLLTFSFVFQIVFSTSLFYLLCASGTQYKPVEVCSNLMPSAGSGTQFGRAVEQAINGVFAASFKMAAFYGLYTWLIHTLFAVKIIYIPSGKTWHTHKIPGIFIFMKLKTVSVFVCFNLVFYSTFYLIIPSKNEKN